jgi:uncharacterized protein YecT (DUF1311 family)
MQRLLFGLRVICLLVTISVPADGQTDAIEHGAAANREYAAVFSRSGKPCSQDYSTTPYVECMNKELAIIGEHLDAFVEDLRGMTGSQQELDALNEMNTKWRAYRESACRLPFKRAGQGGGGTMSAPMSGECEWNLDRAYMQQLSGFYILSQFPNRSNSQ